MDSFRIAPAAARTSSCSRPSNASGWAAAPCATPASRSGDPGVRPNVGGSPVAAIRTRQWFNQYGIILVNPAKHPSVKREMGQAFIDWVISPEGQKAIAEYKIGGEQLFFPNAK